MRGPTPRTTQGTSDGADVAVPSDSVSDINSPNGDTTWTWREILDTNGDGKVDAKDTGITRPTDNSDLRGYSDDNNDLNDNHGTIAASAIRARNTGAVATQPDLVLEFEVMTTFIPYSDGGTPNDPEDDTLQTSEEVDVKIYGHPEVPEDDTTEAVELVAAVLITQNITLSYTAPVPAIGKFNDKGAPTNQVTVSSDAFASGMGVILTETAANSGKFTAMLMICEAGTSGCEAEQVDKDATSDLTDGEGMVKIPANVAGDTIRVTYSDSAPSRTRTASIPLDIDGPSFSNLAPDSGTAGREDEPTVSFDVADTDSGISDDKDAEGQRHGSRRYLQAQR